MLESIRAYVLVKESYNNIFVTVVDLEGRVMTKLSQGLFKESGLSFKKSKPFFYDQIIKAVVAKIYKSGLFQVGLNKFIFRRFVLANFVHLFESILKPGGFALSSSRVSNLIYTWLRIDAESIKSLEGDDEDDELLAGKKPDYDFLRSLYFFFHKLFSLFERYFGVNVILSLNGFFSRRLKYFIFNLVGFEFINLHYLVNYLPVAHNGCRPKKVRRL